MITTTILWLYFQYALLCEKFHNSNAQITEMYVADYSLRNDQLWCGNSIVLHFYADNEENNIIVFFSKIWSFKNSLADFGDTYTIFTI